MIELLFHHHALGDQNLPLVHDRLIIGLADPGWALGGDARPQRDPLPFVRVTTGLIPRIGQLDISPMLVFILA